MILNKTSELLLNGKKSIFMLFKILPLYWCTVIKTKAFATGGREVLQLLEDLWNALSA